MAFYYITLGETKRSQKGQALLAAACERQGVELIAVHPEKFDYTAVPKLTRQDFLYRGANHLSSPAAPMVERALLNGEVTTFYRNSEAALRLPVDSFVVHSRLGLPIPKTIWSLTRDESLLRKAVDFLGGFPVVIKVLDGSQGLGVVRADSWPSLISIVDYVVRTKQRACLREYIDVGVPASSTRAIVLGGQVVFAYRLTQTTSGDFRSNTGKTKRVREQISVPRDQAMLLVQAVESLGWEFGAVDFVERSDGQLVIFEVNFPFRFGGIVTRLSFDLPGAMVSYLQRKSQAKV